MNSPEKTSSSTIRQNMHNFMFHANISMDTIHIPLHSAWNKDATLYEDDKQQRWQYLILKLYIPVFLLVFKNFYWHAFCDNKDGYFNLTHNWCCNCNLGFYVLNRSEVDHVMAETCSCNLVRGKRFFSVPKRKDRLRIPPNLLLNRC